MSPTDGDSLDHRTVFRLVANPHRRYLLSRLDPGERTTVAELARGIAARDGGCDDPSGNVDRSVRRRIEISLVHDHLPRLADHDVVEYGRREKTVVLTNELDVLQPIEAAIDAETVADVG